MESDHVSATPAWPRYRRTGRVVVVALATGVVVFATIAVALSWPIDGGLASEPGPRLCFLGGAVVAVVRRLPVVGGLLVVRARARHREAPLSEAEMAARYHAFTVLRAAPLEALGFLGSITLLLADETWGVVVALGCALGILWMFPTDGRLRRFGDAVRRPE